MHVCPKKYDVIVIGAGHAGVEASLAAARTGCSTLLLSMNVDGVGQMSCNPAIGGLAKGHLAREIDALGGEMGKTTDMTGLQFRMLNTKKGPSVWAPRAQCDKKAYQFRLKWICEREANLDLKQGQVSRLLNRKQKIYGVETTLGIQFLGEVVVVTTGTFLRGLMHVGTNQQTGGRAGESATIGISVSLQELGIELERLKTGTPPRLLRRSIDFSKTEAQPGDDPVPYFTFWKECLWNPESTGTYTEHVGPSDGKYPPGSILDRNNGQLPCYITFTSLRTAEIIRANLHKSPMYSGVIAGIGPRYCPSIEDKIVKFADKDRHQIFLEPEGIATDEIYINGLSTCLPYDVQVDLVRSVIGCEQAEIMRPAYAVEYDFAPPTQLHPWLETKVCENLFLAGQINGTSGYEEAAAQGIMAGINASLRVRKEPMLILKRNEAYIGVLIDDLVTKGTREPYRMFTSRAEHRLLLRQDNADLRLSAVGHQVGLLPDRHFRIVEEKRRAIGEELERLKLTYHESMSLMQILRRPETSYRSLPGCRGANLPEEITRQVEIVIKYEGYIKRQELEIERNRNLEEKQIPQWLDYELIKGLRTEAKQKLVKVRPITVGQAARISGVSSADISLVLLSMRRASAECEGSGQNGAELAVAEDSLST